jgi:hypothetical protein
VLHGVQHPQWHPNTRPWTDIHAICTPACLFPHGLLAACRNSRKSSREKHANRARKALDAVRAAPANRKKRFFRDIFAKCESLIFSRLPISGTKPTVTLIVVYLARVAWELCQTFKKTGVSSGSGDLGHAPLRCFRESTGFEKNAYIAGILHTRALRACYAPIALQSGSYVY